MTRTGRPVSAKRPRAFYAILGLLGVAAGALLLVVGYVAPDGVPLQERYTLRAELRDAANIAPHDTVRLGGRRVGQVLDPRVVGRRALVELQLDPSVAPLRSDTRLVPRSRSVLGQHFIEIIPGRHGRPLADGELIPARQSATIVDLDRALGTFDAVTRRRTMELLDGLGTGAAGRGPQLNRTLAGLPQLAEQLGELAAAVNAHGEPLGRLVEGADRLTGSLDPVRADLADAIEPGARVVGALAHERRSLARALREAPATLGAARRRLPAVDDLLAELRVLASESRPLLATLPGALAETDGLLRDGRPALRALDPTLGRLPRTLPPLERLLTALAPSLPPGGAALRDGRVLFDALGSRPCDLRAVLARTGGPQGAFTFRNDAAGVLRLNLVASPAEFLSGGGDRGGGGITGNAYPAPCAADGERRR